MQYGDDDYTPKEFLFQMIPHLDDFRRTHHKLIAECLPQARWIGVPRALQAWFPKVDQLKMAHHRARLYFKSRGRAPLGVHHVAFARSRSLATRMCRLVSMLGVIATAIAVPSSAHIRHTTSVHQQLGSVDAT